MYEGKSTDILMIFFPRLQKKKEINMKINYENINGFYIEYLNFVTNFMQ
jgi:hypothetical protein